MQKHFHLLALCAAIVEKFCQGYIALADKHVSANSFKPFSPQLDRYCSICKKIRCIKVNILSDQCKSLSFVFVEVWDSNTLHFYCL